MRPRDNTLQCIGKVFRPLIETSLLIHHVLPQNKKGEHATVLFKQSLVHLHAFTWFFVELLSAVTTPTSLLEVMMDISGEGPLSSSPKSGGDPQPRLLMFPSGCARKTYPETSNASCVLPSRLWAHRSSFEEKPFPSSEVLIGLDQAFRKISLPFYS